jgi:hypothetical protein
MTPTKTGFEWLADYEYIRRAIRAELEARPPVLVSVTRTAAPLLAPKHERPGR